MLKATVYEARIYSLWMKCRVVSDSYNKDLSDKTITITAYCETKEQSKILDEYIARMNKKLKRVIQKV